MVSPGWADRILPRDLNGIVMWTISFSMLFLLIRRFDRAKHRRESFWAKESLVETFIILFVWCLTAATFVYYVFFAGDLVVVRTSEELPPLPSTAYSIILSVVAFATFLFTILRYTSRKERKYPAPTNFLFSFAIILLFLGLRYGIMVFAPPWGDPIRSIVNVAIDTSVFGLLFAFIFAGAILYMLRALREE
jgi:MFS family permease